MTHIVGWTLANHSRSPGPVLHVGFSLCQVPVINDPRAADPFWRRCPHHPGAGVAENGDW